MTGSTLPSVPLDDATTRELARAGKHAQTWTERRNVLIREAVANGAGVREVARAVGLNHATVLNIVKPKQRPVSPRCGAQNGDLRCQMQAGHVGPRHHDGGMVWQDGKPAVPNTRVTPTPRKP